MNITNVRIRKFNDEGSRCKALATLTIDDSFVIHHLRVVEGPNGLFVAMPSYKDSNGERHDVAHPITAEARRQIEKAVLDTYETGTYLAKPQE